MQEKLSKTAQDLYQVFIDLTKAFDIVNRETFRLICEK